MEDQIVEQADIDSHRKAAEKEYEQLSSDEIAFIKRRAKCDLFFLAVGILRYNRLSPNLHGHMCKWIQDNRDEQFLGLLAPRSHFKTTVSTISDNVQEVLPPIEGALYPHDLGSEIRIMLAHETLEKSSQFIHEITNHFCSNPRLMGLFPELVPNARKQRINKTQLELPRDSHWSEATFEAFGVGGKSQGRHYDKLNLDDIFGEAARDSKSERATTIQWFRGIQAFFVRLAYSQLRLTGTRYSLDDVYQVAMEVYGDAMKWYIRKVKENGVYIFPEEINDKAVAQLKKDPKIWSSWYLNDPLEGTVEWKPEWKVFYNKLNSSSLAIFTGSNKEIIEHENLDRVVIFDPAISGQFGLVVTGTDVKRIYVLDAYKGRLSPPDQVNMLFTLAMRWKPRVVAIEEVVFSALYKHYIELAMKQRNYYFNIILVKARIEGTGKLSKIERCRCLDTYFSSRQIYMEASQKDLIEEFDEFGSTNDFHIIDALAYGPRLWRFHDLKKYEKYAQIEKDMVTQRDPDTGYSSIYG